MASFKFCNVEPNDEKLQDCVIRAISLATGIRYDDVVKSLFSNGQQHSCDCINVGCYTKLIENLGYYTRNVENYTVGDLADMHPNKVLIIRIRGHL